MKTDLKIDGVMVLTGAAIIAAIGVTYLVKKKGGAVVDAAKDVVTKGLNPASTDNYAYTGINRMGEIFTGKQDWSLGVAGYEFINEDIPAFFAGLEPPGMTITDSSGKTVASVSGADVKKSNANPINMGGIGSFNLSSGSVPVTKNWWDGYTMTEKEKENPFYVESKSIEQPSLWMMLNPITASVAGYNGLKEWWEN